MRRVLSVLLVIALLVPALAFAGDTGLTAAPRAIVELLYNGEYQQVFDQSTADVQDALGTADGLRAIWAQIEQVYGTFEAIGDVSAVEQGGLTVGQVTCSHATADITYTVALTPAGLLCGLTVSGVAQKAAASTADTSKFVTEAITLRAGEADETQGMLTLPVGEGPFPAVIMMQGSGASDMNETAYGISIFRDIAEGLAIAGVASIRYDKYTYVHADLLQNDYTVKEEYLIDAADALALLQADDRIGDVYLLGHSLGGMLVPRVMQTLGADYFAGGIILAGSPLALWEIQYHQNLALLPSLSEADQATAQATIDANLAMLSKMPVMTDEELQNSLFFGISAWYQMDLMSVDTAQTAIALQKPLFIAQGSKDWQVVPEDGIEAWQTALDDQLTANYHLYPNMNHMLCDQEGEPAYNTSDYQAGSTVSEILITDIAAWVLNQ
ncbi:MAG TPA: alpha/beta fold hydrolase [Candidatus Limiplasma sp.]|nr:alpha/beta fold hydrolase [Candidatus Limiplasma sp.]